MNFLHIPCASLDNIHTLNYIITNYEFPLLMYYEKRFFAILIYKNFQKVTNFFKFFGEKNGLRKTVKISGHIFTVRNGVNKGYS